MVKWNRCFSSQVRNKIPICQLIFKKRHNDLPRRGDALVSFKQNESLICSQGETIFTSISDPIFAVSCVDQDCIFLIARCEEANMKGAIRTFTGRDDRQFSYRRVQDKLIWNSSFVNGKVHLKINLYKYTKIKSVICQCALIDRIFG